MDISSCLPQFAVGPELELEELVAELALVANVVAEVEIVRHPRFNELSLKIQLSEGYLNAQSLLLKLPSSNLTQVT